MKAQNLPRSDPLLPKCGVEPVASAGRASSVRGSLHYANTNKHMISQSKITNLISYPAINLGKIRQSRVVVFSCTYRKTENYTTVRQCSLSRTN